MLRTLEDFKQCAIAASDGDIGHVKDLYFDDHAWVIRYLIVDTGTWLSGREVLISPISIKKPDWAAHRIPAAITRDQVENSPSIDSDKPVSRQHELQYLGYYGYSNYWGGPGMWGEGMFPLAMYPGYIDPPGGRAEREAWLEEYQQAERARHRADDPNLRSCEAVSGYHLEANDGEVGHVEGFLVDDETWAIRYIVVNTSNWWLGHKVLIAPTWIKDVRWSDRTVSVDLSRTVVQASPVYDPEAMLDRQRETGLYAHYRRAPYWKAGAAIVHQS